ncbi:MAG: tetratricopeptide repeat protein [Longimicrobiales bacterium]
MNRLERIRERKIVQWGLAYAAVAWLLLEGAQMVGDAFAWPAGVQQGLIVLAAVGLVAALVLAWFHGEKGRQRVSGSELLILASLAVVAGAGLTRIGRGSGTPVAEDGNGPSGPAAALAQEEPVVAPPSATSERSIAVLPFENLSSDPEDAFFALAVADEVTHALQQVGGLRVINRTSVGRYADSSLSLREIATSLGAERVLSGSVQRQGDEVRISTQLVDAQTDSQLWSDRYLRQLDDVFLVQAEIAERIAEALEGEFGPTTGLGIAAGMTESVTAYQLYHRGRTIWNEEPHGPETVRRAMDLIAEALVVDSTFARARADYSMLYADLAGFEGLAMVDSALAQANHAVAQAPEMGDGYGARCFAQDRVGLTTAALPDCLKAIELAPASGDAQLNLGAALVNQGRFAEALPWLEAGRQSMPELAGINGALASLWRTLGDSARAEAFYEQRRLVEPEEVEADGGLFWLYWDYEHLESARESLERMVALDPDHWEIHRVRAHLALIDGRPDEAVASMLRFHEVEPPEWNPPTLLAYAYAQAGDRARADSTAAFAEALARNYRQLGDETHWIERTFASVATLRGDFDEAVRQLETAVDRGLRGARDLEHDILRQPLRGHPGFERLLERLRPLDTREHARALQTTTLPGGRPN